MKKRNSIVRWILPLIFLAVLITLLRSLSKQLPEAEASRLVKVLAYSSFMNSWGPGPEIAKRFQTETGIEVQFHDAGDSGLLLKKLELFPADAVIGFDQLTLPEARSARKWRDLSNAPGLPENLRFKEAGFLPFDWGPMGFVYREGEIEPPKNFNDLLDARFQSTMALQDPRTSTPGIQFLFWVLDEMGIDEGFAFLAKLKPNIHSVGSNWTTSYGAFTKKEAKLAFSYVTSPLYHVMNENDRSYKAAIFESGHPVQVEYAAVPESCGNCTAGERFVLFLLKPDIQKIIMEKNVMMPVIGEAATGTEFATMPQAQVREWKNLPLLLEKRQELFDRWRDLGL